MAVENSSRVIPLQTLPGNLVDWSSLLSPSFFRYLSEANSFTGRASCTAAHARTSQARLFGRQCFRRAHPAEVHLLTNILRIRILQTSPSGHPQNHGPIHVQKIRPLPHHSPNLSPAQSGSHWFPEHSPSGFLKSFTRRNTSSFSIAELLGSSIPSNSSDSYCPATEFAVEPTK